jgi:hypothetical protein
VLEDRVLPSSGPFVLRVTPTGVRNAVFDHVDVTFNEAIDATTFAPAQVSLRGPAGSVAVTGVSSLSPETFRITFAALTRGTYQAAIGPNIADLAGNRMDQDQDGTGGAPDDGFQTSLVSINANAILTSPITINEGDTTYDGKDVLIDGTTVTINGSHSFDSVQLIDGAVLTHSADTATASHDLDLTVTQQVIVDAASRIDVSGKGRLSGGETAGGSYGGLGGGVVAIGGIGPNPVYGDYADADQPGSGGVDSGSAHVAAGGGLVRLTAATLQLDGQLRADGGSDIAAGSGGGVYVAVTTLAGTGSISAAGGQSGGDGGGGGGRIAVYARELSGFNAAAIIAPGGGGTSPGGAGTVYLRNPTDPSGTLIFDAANGGAGTTPLGLPGQDTFTIPDAVVVRGGATDVRPEHAGMTIRVQAPLTVEASGHLLGVDGTLAVSGPTLVTGGGSLVITGALTAAAAVTVDGGTLAGGTITAPAVSVIHGGVLTSPTPTFSQVYPLLLQVAGTVSVDAASRIDVSGEGRLMGGKDGGGSYGGLGGLTGGTTNPVYGDYADPDQPGSGAYDSGSNTRVAGGGLVRLTAATLQLNGALRADGGSTTAFGSAGGSGGGVYVAVTTLTGAGSISAAGGPGSDAGGGGGRVAVYAQDLSGFNAAAITAPGGGGTSPGGAGTVHVVQGAPHTHVRSYAPVGRNGNYVPVLDHVTVTFNNAIDTSAANLANFVIDGQMGRVQATGITLVGDRTYQFAFPPLTEDGPYSFTLLPTLLDAQGFPLDQNADGSPGDPGDFYSFTLTVDTIPPRATRHSPAGDVAGTVDHVDVWMSKAIDPTTFTAARVAITRPDGGTVAVGGIAEVGLNRFHISFAGQTLVGQYHVRVGPNVADLAGNLMNQDGNGIPGEPGDVYDASFNLVPVNLGLSNLTLGSDHLTAGQPVTVSWQGANLTGAALLGAWTDAVYLSTSDHWDINAVLLDTVPHTGGLAQGQPYSASATAVIPGALPGNYHILVRSDIYNQEQQGAAQPINVIATPVPLTVTSLAADGGTAHGTLTADDPSNYFAVQVNGGASLGLVLTGHADTAVNELYASFEQIPTRLSYDYRSVKWDQDLTGRSQSLALVAPPGGGTFYILIYGAQTASPPDYDLSANTARFIITTITPDRGSNRPPDVASSYNYQPVGRFLPETVTIDGAGFDAGTTVQFLAGDGTVHAPTAMRLVSPQQLTLALDLTSWPAGAYDVRVAKGAASQVFPGAFTVVGGGIPHLETDLVTPDTMGFHVLTAQVLWVEYKNTGDAPMPAPILKLSADDQARLTADPAVAFPTPPFQDLPASVTDTVQVLATGSGGTPGILQPGDSGRIPIYYLGRGYFPTHQMTFSLSDLTADDVTWAEILPSVAAGPGGGGGGGGPNIIEHNWHVDWTNPTLRPESVSADAWGGHHGKPDEHDRHRVGRLRCRPRQRRQLPALHRPGHAGRRQTVELRGRPGLGGPQPDPLPGRVRGRLPGHAGAAAHVQPGVRRADHLALRPRPPRPRLEQQLGRLRPGRVHRRRRPARPRWGGPLFHAEPGRRLQPLPGRPRPAHAHHWHVPPDRDGPGRLAVPRRRPARLRAGHQREPDHPRLHERPADDHHPLQRRPARAGLQRRRPSRQRHRPARPGHHLRVRRIGRAPRPCDPARRPRHRVHLRHRRRPAARARPPVRHVPGRDAQQLRLRRQRPADADVG